MMLKRMICLLLLFGLVLMIPVAFTTQAEEKSVMKDKIYRLWYDTEAPQTMDGFEKLSLPLGNGYMGVNVFGGVSTELISVTENSMFNPSSTRADFSPSGEERCTYNNGGLNLLAKTYIDFAHSNVENYQRDLVLNDAVAHVSYEYEGVTYEREYFSTYPDKVTVMRLSASQAGKLSFTLRPVAPFCNDYLTEPGDGKGKTGKVTASGDTITVKGTMDFFDINYEGLYKVIPQGGTMKAANDQNGANGTITVTGADSAVIILAVGTNYHLEPESFYSSGTTSKMDANEDPHEKVQGYLDAAAGKSYEELLSAHMADYKELFDRAQLDLGGVPSDTVTTAQLVNNYKSGSYDPYLEEMVFQFGRYLLIASSREGCLPANLQGIWNFSDAAAWSGGYWHNINIQMNYWPAFSTGLSELFQSYVDYNEAFRPVAQKNADTFLVNNKAPNMEPAGTGQNGWAVGTGCNPYRCAAPSTSGHSGPGTGAFTSLLFWDYYDFTRDETILREHTYPALEGMAIFLSKTLKQYDDGKWLVYNSASPENADNYRSIGTAFDQQMVYENHLVTLKAAEALGYTEQDYPILATIKEQIDHLDPVNVGYSGQVKEYREENYYGEIGEAKHRHISQLVGAFPGTAINGTTDAWLDAAGVSLKSRGSTGIGWAKAHRLLVWARIQDSAQAYAMVQGLLSKNTGYNLWGIYSSGMDGPFQIDSNFGYTAGVAEMLVQGHAGYIEFLPAIPEQWSEGSFRGLTTRGNFAVDAKWKNGVATEFAIKSGSGLECAVKYPNISGAVVTDSKGNTVRYTADSGDLLRFATTAGETYYITEIPSHTPNLAAPTGLTLSADGGKMNLRWTASEGAVSYNVYRAVNDAPSYERIAQGVTGTTYTYEPTDILGSDRVTMRVVAVAADGTESPSALAYSLPLTPLEKVTGYLFEGNELQLEYAAVENATEYRIYKSGTLVAASRYPIAGVSNADPNAAYSVSVVVDGRESSATVAELMDAGSKVNKVALWQAVQSYGGQDVTSADFAGVPVAYILAEAEAKNLLTDAAATQNLVDRATKNLTDAATEANIFKGRPVAVNLKHTTSSTANYSPELMVDGDTTSNKSRWAVSAGANSGTTEDHAVVTITLDGLYHLKGVFVQEFLNNNQVTNGGQVTIEVSTDGSTWATVLSGVSLRDYRDGVPISSSSNTAFVFDSSVLASQVRLTFDDSKGSSGAITIYEIQGYGDAVDVDSLYLSSNTLTLSSGMTHKLTASSENVRWTSSDPSVVAVDSNGVLTAVNCGKATITATDENGATATCQVTVSTDTAKLVAAIAVAEESMAGVVTSERTADKVLKGIKFVPAAVMTNLQSALADAKELAEAPTDAATVDNLTATLERATESFLKKLQTGTMSVTKHVHCVCTDALEHTCTDLTWTAWGDDIAERTSLPNTNGNYYLVWDIVTVEATSISEKNAVNLCLNGFNITNTNETVHLYNIYGTLSICDCSEEADWGRMTGSRCDSDSSADVPGGTLQLRDNKAGYTAICNLYSGIISADTAHAVTRGGIVHLGNSNANGSVFNMYGGKLTGGNAVNGGAVYILSKSTFNLYGGEISGNTATTGGAIYAQGTLNIFDGQIVGGNVKTAGCIYADSADIYIHGGTVTGGKATNWAGLIFVDEESTLTITGGKLSGGSAKWAGNINLEKGATATMSGGTIENGKSTGGAGGNVYANGGSFTMTGGTITGGTANTNGGNVYVQGGGKVSITGGVITDGNGEKGGNVYLASGTGTIKNAQIYFTAATENISIWNHKAKLTLGGKLTHSEYGVDLYQGGGTLTLSSDLQVDGVLTTDGASDITELCTGTQAQAAMFAGVGTRSISYNGTKLIFAEPGVEIWNGDTKENAYPSMYSALRDLTQGQYLKLTGDAWENVTLDAQLYLDLAGHTWSGNIAGEGTLYGMDSTGDAYQLPTGRIEGNISCQVADNFKTDVTEDVKRYMAIADETGYTFHRIYVGLDRMSLAPAHTGVGYKAVFAADEAVQALLAETETYGFILWVGDEGKKHTFSKDADTFTSGDPLTLRLQNFDVAGYGETKVYGQVFLKLSDGTVIESCTYSYTLRELVESVASNISDYSARQITALQAMINANEKAMKDWDIDSIRNYSAN